MSVPEIKQTALPRDRASQTKRPLLSLYAVTIFLGAFLLFQVQPLFSKAILPWFGGTAGVWTTCMLFFQVLLFLGYAYAHLSTTYLTPHRQGIVHTALLVAALALMAVLHVRPAAVWKPDGTSDPIVGILVLLTTHVGLPFFLLSATSPLLQVWWNRAVGSGTPYRLYALSNTGSLLALLSYPFIFERWLSLSVQSVLWSLAFVLQAVLLVASGAAAWWRPSTATEAAAHENSENTAERANDDEPISNYHRLLWIGLAAAGSVMLLATTSHISHDVAVVPLLWIVPLSLYLITFILCFSGVKIPRWFFIGLMLFITGYVAADKVGAVRYVEIVYGIWLPHITGLVKSYFSALVGYLWAMFTCCMVCHGELWQLKPPARHLTAFYLYVALGGALGGIGCGVLAPLLLPAYYEFSIGMALCWFLLIASLFASRATWMSSPWLRWSFAGLIFLFVIFGVSLTHDALNVASDVIDRSRNFFGVLEVEERIEPGNPEGDHRRLVNGLITHGAQLMDTSQRHKPTTYYTAPSGVGVVMAHTELRKHRRIGVVGLGVGTLAAYGLKDDYFRFYDINPEVVRFAQEYFTYLKDTEASGAEYEIAMGDARLSLERELESGAAQQFDVLVLDAFSSDAIPLHLLTTEAFDVYLQHLRNDEQRQGIILVHISNRYLDLLPLTQALAAHYDLDIVQISSDDVDDSNLAYSATWILLSRPGGLETIMAEEADAVPMVRLLDLPAWSDDSINLPSLLSRD
jgi:hypothetical protein